MEFRQHVPGTSFLRHGSHLVGHAIFFEYKKLEILWNNNFNKFE